MKYTGLIFWIVLLGWVCEQSAGALDFSNDVDFDSYNSIVDENINIVGGGTYSLFHLGDIITDTRTVLINTGSPAELVILSVDNHFNGGDIFSKNLDIQNIPTYIRLDNDFLETIVGENSEIIRFENLSFNRKPDVIEQIGSGNYDYDIVDCNNGTGKCIRRLYSEAYRAAHQISSGLAGVTSIIQYTPSVLLRPVLAMNQHELFDVYNFADDYFVSVVPEYYNARDFNNVGMRVNAGTKITGQMFVGLSAYLSGAEFKYGVDDFDYAVYGGNLRLLYDLDDMVFVRGVGGISLAKIKSDAASVPNVFSSYFGMDIGTQFKFESGLFLSPFVGAGTTNASIVGVHKNSYLLHTGADVGFKYFMDGVSYSYNLRAGVNTGGYVDASVGINAWTVSDKIGGGVSIGVVDTEFGWSGKVSANVRFAF